MNHAAKHRQPRPGSRPGKPKRAHQKGVTLFELLLVLFVAAFVAVAVATIYNRVNTTYKENTLFNDVQQLAANIRSLYGGQGNFNGLQTSVVVNAEIAPTTLVNGTNTIHPFSNTGNNNWTVTTQNNAEEFLVTINNIPNASVCSGLASKGLNTVNEVKVGNTSVLDVTAIANACSTNSGTVVYVYN